MIRVFSEITLVIVVTLYTHLSAQDAVDTSRSAASRSVAENGEGPPSRTQSSFEELDKDAPLKPVAATVAAIEEVLKQTGRIAIRFSGHQVMIPIVSDASLSKIATLIHAHCKDSTATKLDAGRMALHISSESDIAVVLALPILNVIFVERGERPIVTNSSSKITMRDGLPASPLEPTDSAVERVLSGAKILNITLGSYYVAIPLSDKSPRLELARAIVKLVKQYPVIDLLDGREHLIVKIPIASVQSVFESLLGTLTTAPDPRLAAQTKSQPFNRALGGGGGFGGFGGEGNFNAISPLPRQAMPSNNYISSKNVVIAFSDKGDRAWGYSRQLGKWSTLTFDLPFEKLIPIISQDIGCLYNGTMPSDKDKGRYVWGYSNTTGKWDKLTLPAGSKAMPTLHADMIMVEHGEQIHIFSDRSGKWSTPPKPGDEVAQNEGGTEPAPLKAGAGRDTSDPVFKVMKLEHALASDVATVLQQMFQDPRVTIVPDTRTNALFVKAPRELLTTIEDLWRQLDEKLSASTSETRDLSVELNFEIATKARRTTLQLKDKYEAREREAGEIVRQIRNTPGSDANLKSKLRQAVAEAFELRQQLHRAELDAFQQRMAKVQKTIRTRDGLKDKIIDRRVEDLLNPNLNWDAKPQLKTVTTAGPTELEGDWSLESIKGGGVLSGEQGLKVRVRGQQWIVLRGQHEAPYSIVVNSAANPKTVDLMTEFADGRPPRIEKGIYRLEGDTLIISYGAAGKGRPTEFNGQEFSIHTLKRIHEPEQFVQLHITSPEGATIKWMDEAANGSGSLIANPVLPLRRNLLAGKLHRLQLSDVPTRPGLEQFVSLEIPLPSATSRDYLSLNAIPLQFTNEDFDQVQAGNSVVKVIYMPNPQVESAPSSVEVMVNARLDQGVDVVVEARKRGQVLAIIGISKEQGEAANQSTHASLNSGSPASAGTPNAQPDDAGIFDASESKYTLAKVGDVKDVTNPELVVIALVKPEECKIGDQWEVVRLLDKNIDGGHGRLIGRVEVIKYIEEGTVLARVLKSTITLGSDETVPEAIRVGDDVRRRVRNRLIEKTPVNPQSGAGPFDGQLILKGVKDFQKRFLEAEHFVESNRQLVSDARAALAAGTGTQATVDANQELVDDSLKKLDALRAEYEARVSVLDLNTKAAKKALEIAEAEFKQSQNANRLLPGTVSQQEQQRLKVALAALTLDFEHATTLLELYRKVAPTRPVSTPNADQSEAEALLWEHLGLRIKSIDAKAPAWLPKFYGGLQVLDVRAESPAFKATIKAGDILVGLGKWETRTPDHAVFAIRNNQQQPAGDGKGPLKFYVSRNGAILFGQIELPLIADDPTVRKSWTVEPRPMTYSLKFTSEPWRGFLLWLGRTTDRGLDMQVDPEGRFTHVTKEPLRLDEILAIVNAELEPQGIQVTVTDTEISVVRKDRATVPNPREQTNANLRNLILAMSHYHDQHKHFPPATILGKDGKGKVPHGWRVEILPQLGEQKLYDEYHFDEPWDSEHNKSLLAKMPAVFRSPLDKPDSQNTSYFGLVTPGFKPRPYSGASATASPGPAPAGVLNFSSGTVFSNPLGTTYRDIHDGTANTVVLVEAKRAVAWTKPEDIPYSADQPVPMLGGWFPEGWHAAFAEGSVKQISPDNPEATIRARFTIGGGESVKLKLVEDK